MSARRQAHFHILQHSLALASILLNNGIKESIFLKNEGPGATQQISQINDYSLIRHSDGN